MKIFFPILLLVYTARGAALAAPFTEPQAHPISRYEAGWQKNPFTLKTAPISMQKESFAKDLALAGWRQAGDDNIVILVNIKTREYSRLRNKEPASDGTKVKSAHLEDRHADTFVELERNNETAIVRYDEGFLRQMAAQGAASKPNPNAAKGQNTLAGMNVNSSNTTTPNQPQSSAPLTSAGMASNGQASQPALSTTNKVPTKDRRRLNTLPQPPTQK